LNIRSLYRGFISQWACNKTDFKSERALF